MWYKLLIVYYLLLNRAAKASRAISHLRIPAGIIASVEVAMAVPKMFLIMIDAQPLNGLRLSAAKFANPDLDMNDYEDVKETFDLEE